MTEEFKNHFRLCLERELSSEEARVYILLVSKFAELDPTDDEVAMVYHLMDDNHCYDIRLAKDVDEQAGSSIFMALEEMFPDEDFSCEASMDTVSEQLYLNNALIENLNKSLF